MNSEEPLGGATMRLETAAAFAHEIRTPLTSLVMAVELARAPGAEGSLHFEPELASLLRSSIEGLLSLADLFQEVSRLERGRARLVLGEHSLGSIVEQAGAQAMPIVFEGPAVGADLRVTWDGPRMAGALAGLATGVDRAGFGAGRVQLSLGETGPALSLTLSSGQDEGGRERPMGPDAGFGFYAGWLVVLAHGGTVEAVRREGFMRVALGLPRHCR